MEKEVEDEKEGDGGGLYAGERQTLSSGCRSLSLSRLSLSTLFLFLFLFVPLHISLWPLSLSLPTSFPCFVAVRRRRRRSCLFLSLSLSLSLYLSLSSPTCHRVSPSATRVSLHTPLVLLSIETRGLSLSLARVSLSLSLFLSLSLLSCHPSRGSPASSLASSSSSQRLLILRSSSPVAPALACPPPRASHVPAAGAGRGARYSKPSFSFSPHSLLPDSILVPVPSDAVCQSAEGCHPRRLKTRQKIYIPRRPAIRRCL